MQKNLVSRIMNAFNLTLNEQFKVKRNNVEYTCKFVTNALIAIGLDYDFGKKLLADIICGDAVVIGKVWKPSKYDDYYTFKAKRDAVWTVTLDFWCNYPSDFANLSAGWVYRTKEEAMIALPVVAKGLGVEYSV